MLGAAQISKGKERVKKPPASSRPLVYLTRQGMGLGKAPLSFQDPYKPLYLPYGTEQALEREMWE